MIDLAACRVKRVEPRVARAIIRRHEHLRTSGNARHWYGLSGPACELLALVSFGHGPHAAGEVTLERGWIAPEAPRNAGSFLIARAIRAGGWSRVEAFTNGRFGELGALYKVAGFRLLPPSKHGKPWRYAMLYLGRTYSDRAIYRTFGSHAAARRAPCC